MPELPEVETIIIGLRDLLINKSVLAVEVKDYNHKINGDLTNLINNSVISINRFGKYLIFNFSNKKTLLVHLRMTGQFIFEDLNARLRKSYEGQQHKTTKISDLDEIINQNSVINKKSKVKFYLKDNLDRLYLLIYNDWRKFGTMNLIESKDLKKIFKSKNLGEDALSESLTFSLFNHILSKKGRSKIKSTLMDQKVISGLGNIYAQEVCFFAKVLPDRKINTLNSNEIKLLYDGMRSILIKAIKFNGTSFDNAYVTSKGVPGDFSTFLNVYMIKQCKVCSTDIKNVKINSRSSYFCPNCQD